MMDVAVHAMVGGRWKRGRKQWEAAVKGGFRRWSSRSAQVRRCCKYCRRDDSRVRRQLRRRQNGKGSVN